MYADKGYNYTYTRRTVSGEEMKEQSILTASEFKDYVTNLGDVRFMAVCDGFLLREANSRLKWLNDVVFFSDFAANPDYVSAESAVDIFKKNNCRGLIAIGGGSCMDVAKCIKLFAMLDEGKSYLEQPLVNSDIPLIAIPTTAGSGSEATRYAVIYHNGEKQSITQESCIPDAAVFASEALKSLPLYQKKAGLLDALCHGIESFWSVNSTPESREYSDAAIRLVLENYRLYLAGDFTAAENMLRAANLAGKAINITQTTAGHAMCYKLTTLYGIAHGHAAALCLYRLMGFTVFNTDKCVDPRGKNYLENTLSLIAHAMNCESFDAAAGRMGLLLSELELSAPTAQKKDLNILVHSVNPIRLKNNPILLSEEDIDRLYRKIMIWGD